MAASKKSQAGGAKGGGNAEYDYDLIVIGGGSGGLACAQAAAEKGAKVAVFDYVAPSPQGSTWGLGGTCVNVGCIPKKLFHYSALLRQGMTDAKHFGWKQGAAASSSSSSSGEEKGKAPQPSSSSSSSSSAVPAPVELSPSLDWDAMVTNIQDYIGGLNWSYRVALRERKVKYINAKAAFAGPHSVLYTDKKTKAEVKLTAARFVVATGGRPRYPSEEEVPGALEHCITSDDLFSLYKPPGRTLIVGASYIALECAGALTEMGIDTTVLVRSIFLRGFDSQVAEIIGDNMAKGGTRIVRPATPLSITKDDKTGRLSVVYQNRTTKEKTTEVFDTVVLAIGRNPCTPGLGLDKAGVKLSAKQKILTNDADATNVPHIFAIGDVAEGRPELTPAAIQAGRLLAGRMFGGSRKLMDYAFVPTTVFTPYEYGAVGYSQEDAEAKFGKDKIDTYLSRFGITEIAAAHRVDHQGGEWIKPCFAKLVVDKSRNERVVGFHIVGPNAGDITQGFALAVRLGATKADFDDLVGIHPTTAEELTELHVTGSSGEAFEKVGGC